MKKNKVIGLIATTLVGGAMLSACGDSSLNDLWIVKDGFDVNQEGTYGMIYLDSSNYDFYQYQHKGWEYIANISSQIKDKKISSIKAGDNGYWSINGSGLSYKSYEKDNVLEYLTRSDYYSQIGIFGSLELASKKVCSLIFSTEMMKDTTVSFKESLDTYSVTIGEKINNEISYFEDGWDSESEYRLTNNSLPYINVTRNDNKEMTQDELLGLHTMFDINGVKVKKEYSPTLTDEQYLNQVVHFGSVPSPAYKSRIRMTFGVRVEKGSTVTFLGNLSQYRWAVVEMYDVTSSTGYLDSGWSSAWTEVDKTKYTTKLDDIYMVITLSKASGGNFETTDFANMHSMFKVEANISDDKGIWEQKDEGLSSTAHRGYSYRGPENTLSAYRLARKYGFKKAECDVKFTKDNIPVLLHDDTIDRTSNGTGAIKNMTFEEARKYDYGSWKSKEFIGEQIPTFDEFVALCKELNLHPYIELKSNVNAEQAQILVDIVNKYDYLSDVSWISFDFNSLKEIVKIDEEARIGYTQSNITIAFINDCGELKTKYNEVFMNSSFSAVNASTVKMCKDADLPLEVWTVNTIKDLLNLDPYVTGLASDWINASYVLN